MDIVLSKNGVKCAVFKISDDQRYISYLHFLYNFRLFKMMSVASGNSAAPYSYNSYGNSFLSDYLSSLYLITILFLSNYLSSYYLIIYPLTI